MKSDRVMRTFEVLELLSRHREGLRLTTINQSLELPLSSTHNLMKAMVEAELVTMAPDRRYRVGPRALRLSIRLVDGIAVREVARRHLPKLVEDIGYDVYLAMRVGHNVVYVDRFEGSHPVSIDIRLGQNLYLHATSVGKLFSAFHADLRARALSGRLPKVTSNTITDARQLEAALDQIRRDGFSVSRGEGVDGINGLAVPLRDAAGTVVAAIHVSIVEAAGAGENRLLRAAMKTAERVEREMGVLDTHELELDPAEAS